MRVNASQIQLGKTFYDGETPVATDLKGGHHLGTESYFNAADPAAKIKLKSQKQLKGILVRNTSGIALLPNMMVVWATRGQTVNGYTRTTGEECAGVVDPYLPAAGVVDDDIFWLIVEGEVLVKRQVANLAADVAVGDILYALTAAASTFSTTAGRFTRWVGTFSAAETTDGDAAKIFANRIGRAMSTSATSAGDVNVLVDLKIQG